MVRHAVLATAPGVGALTCDSPGAGGRL